MCMRMQKALYAICNMFLGILQHHKEALSTFQYLASPYVLHWQWHVQQIMSCYCVIAAICSS